MKAKLNIALFLCLLLPSLPVLGQLQNIRIPFEHLSTREGLVSNRVTSIIKDSMGFYWYGTNLGLNRHDGNELELFQHEADNPNTLPDDYIDQLVVANQYVIAGLTTKGNVFVYDYRNSAYNKIRRIALTGVDNTLFKTQLITSDGQHLYAINGNGDIMRIDLSSFASYFFLPSASSAMATPYVALFHYGYLWVGGENGFFKLDTATCTLTNMDLSFYSDDPKGNLSISVIEPYDEQHFLLSCKRSAKFPCKGIIKFNFTNHTDTALCLYGMGKNLDEYPIDIVKKLKGSTLFLRIHALSRFIYDIDTHIWDTLAVRSNHTRYLNTSSLNCVAVEQNDRYRIASNQGIFIHLPEIAMFEEYYPHKGVFYARQWTGLFRKENKMLYVGTQAAVNTFNTKSDKLEATAKFPCVQDHHRTNQQPALILLDSTRLLVLSSYIYTYDITQNSFILLENDSASQLPITIQSNLYPYTIRGPNCYMIRDGRLYRIHLKTLAIQAIPIFDKDHQEAYFDASGLSFDRSGYLWISTYNKGLVRCNIENVEYKEYTLFDNRCALNDIIIDSKNTAWIASSGCGLIKVNIEDPYLLRYEQYSKKEGYVSQDLYQVMEDQYNRIWSTSGYGLNYFEKTSGNVYNFSKAHGIEYPHNFFRGKTMDEDGNFYVSGGINIVKIDPKKFQQVTSPPPVYIKQFQINNQAVAAFWKDTSITLRANQNNFSFHLSAVNHIHPNLNKYKYKMENFHSDWISTYRNQLFIPFTNLQPGTYTFRAIASNHEGVWNAKGINIQLRILPYFYETWWFRIGAVLAVLALLYLLFRLRTERLLAIQRIDIEKKIALEAERSRISRDMHDDLGSGLSAIHLLSNYLNENAALKYPEFSAQIDKIRESSEELNESIREIIWTVNVKDDTLSSLVLFLRRYCHELHEKTRIPIYVHTEDPVPELQLSGGQRKHIFLCLKEALNNAIKHGKPSEINIRITSSTLKEVTIRIHDNGSGFAAGDLNNFPLGNGLTNMKERMREIGGSAEIKSGSGTEVTLRFKA